MITLSISGFRYLTDMNIKWLCGLPGTGATLLILYFVWILLPDMLFFRGYWGGNGRASRYRSVKLPLPLKVGMVAAGVTQRMLRKHMEIHRLVVKLGKI